MKRYINGEPVEMSAQEEAAFEASRATPLAASKADAAKAIDAEADAIYGAVLGNRSAEYMEAESDATAYKAAGYTGTVPAGVKSWVDAKAAAGITWTNQQAADDILATAAGWRSAKAAIRAARLARKEQIKGASDAAAVATSLAAWKATAAAIRAQLGI